LLQSKRPAWFIAGAVGVAFIGIVAFYLHGWFSERAATEAFLRAQLEANKKQYDRAIADYTEVIRLRQGDSVAYSNRAAA